MTAQRKNDKAEICIFRYKVKCLPTLVKLRIEAEDDRNKKGYRGSFSAVWWSLRFPGRGCRHPRRSRAQQAQLGASQLLVLASTERSDTSGFVFFLLGRRFPDWLLDVFR